MNALAISEDAPKSVEMPETVLSDERGILEWMTTHLIPIESFHKSANGMSSSKTMPSLGHVYNQAMLEVDDLSGFKPF